MNTREKAAFLRAEGWRQRRSNRCYWAEPRRTGAIWDTIAPLDEAYAIASRRKAQRERAALKKAGWEYHVLGDGKGNIYTRWCWSEKKDNGRCKFAETRAEALKQLGIK